MVLGKGTYDCVHHSGQGSLPVARHLYYDGFCTLFALTSIRGLEGKLGELLSALSRDGSLVILFCADVRLRMSDAVGMTGEIVTSLAPDV